MVRQSSRRGCRAKGSVSHRKARQGKTGILARVTSLYAAERRTMITRKDVLGNVHVMIITAFDVEPVGRIWSATKKQIELVNSAGVPTYTLKTATYDRDKARVVYTTGYGFAFEQYDTVVNCLLDKS